MRGDFSPLIAAGFKVRSLPPIVGERAKILVERDGCRLTLEAADLDECDRFYAAVQKAAAPSEDDALPAREGWSGDDVDSRLQDIRGDIAAQRQGPRDSPRWCDRCQAWGDHHSDRCTRPEPAPDAIRDDYNPNCEVRHG